MSAANKTGQLISFQFVYEDREIELCCKSCLKTFKKEPAKYMKKLAEASAK